MPAESEQIKALREVSEKAKHASRDEDGWFDDLDFKGELQHALCVVGDEKLLN